MIDLAKQAPSYEIEAHPSHYRGGSHELLSYQVIRTSRIELEISRRLVEELPEELPVPLAKPRISAQNHAVLLRDQFISVFLLLGAYGLIGFVYWTRPSLKYWREEIGNMQNLWPSPNRILFYSSMLVALVISYLFLGIAVDWSIKSPPSPLVYAVSNVILDNQLILYIPLAVAIFTNVFILTITKAPSVSALLGASFISILILWYLSPLFVLSFDNAEFPFGIKLSLTTRQSLLCMWFLLLFGDPRIKFKSIFKLIRGLGFVVAVWAVLSVGVSAFAESSTGLGLPASILWKILVVMVGTWVAACSIGGLL